MGIDVFVLEKHADFLRDFREDTIHPSTLEIMHELGILDEFLKRPHQEIRDLLVRWDRIASQSPISGISRPSAVCGLALLYESTDREFSMHSIAARQPPNCLIHWSNQHTVGSVKLFLQRSVS
jgi:2-polyprenyl-6-methoxyphenol hydroxylase-like FAD-dependent oxidoreductase